MTYTVDDLVLTISQYAPNLRPQAEGSVVTCKKNASFHLKDSLHFRREQVLARVLSNANLHSAKDINSFVLECLLSLHMPLRKAPKVQHHALKHLGKELAVLKNNEETQTWIEYPSHSVIITGEHVSLYDKSKQDVIWTSEHSHNNLEQVFKILAVRLKEKN